MRRWSLRSRLVLLLIAAVIPAAVLAALATVHVQQATREARAQAVVQRSIVTGTRVQIKLARADDLLDNLAADPDVTAGGASCPAILSGALAGRRDYAAVMVAGAGGKPICTAGDPTARLDDNVLAHIASGDQNVMQGVLSGSGKGAPSELFYLGRPAKAADGSSRALAVTLRSAALHHLLAFGPAEDPHMTVMLVRGDGHIAARGGAASPTVLPPALLASASANPLQGEFGRGDSAYFYSVMPIARSTLFVAAAAPAAAIDAVDWTMVAIRFGVPLLMLTIAAVVIYLGLERLVLRWVRELNEARTTYEKGEVPPRLDHFVQAPRDMADLGHCFDGMIARLDEHALAVDVAVEGKNRLLRELHHRVKNNFQMIASLLALQRREMPGAMRNLLRVPEDRVLAMAAAYKASYASGEIGQVDLVELMRDVAAQIRQSFGLAAPLVQVARSGDPVTVDLDRAVPLGLLVSEVLSGALERSEDTAGSVRVDIEDLPTDDGASLVEIAVKGAAIGTTPPESGLANRLIAAYLAQLNASLQRSDDKIAIVFAIEPGLASAPSRMEIGMA